MKSYAAAGQALLLMGFVPLYSWFSSRVDREKLVLGVTLFFIVNVELFFLGAKLGVPYLGVVFYIWVGIFSLATTWFGVAWLLLREQRRVVAMQGASVAAPGVH